jgi:hypothetical protein
MLYSRFMGLFKIVFNYKGLLLLIDNLFFEKLSLVKGQALPKFLMRMILILNTTGYYKFVFEPSPTKI